MNNKETEAKTFSSLLGDARTLAKPPQPKEIDTHEIKSEEELDTLQSVNFDTSLTRNEFLQIHALEDIDNNQLTFATEQKQHSNPLAALFSTTKEEDNKFMPDATTAFATRFPNLVSADNPLFSSLIPACRKLALLGLGLSDPEFDVTSITITHRNVVEVMARFILVAMLCGRGGTMWNCLKHPGLSGYSKLVILCALAHMSLRIDPKQNIQKDIPRKGPGRLVYGHPHNLDELLRLYGSACYHSLDDGKQNGKLKEFSARLRAATNALTPRFLHRFDNGQYGVIPFAFDQVSFLRPPGEIMEMGLNELVLYMRNHGTSLDLLSSDNGYEMFKSAFDILERQNKEWRDRRLYQQRYRLSDLEYFIVQLAIAVTGQKKTSIKSTLSMKY
ncbi:MAG TPA: hypothetical protein VEF04_17160 [Blastocatellia bacterium]|nr:hypothetical protein [Blastocatellia bacterium]